MIVTYVPDDGEKIVWTFKPGRVMTTEAEAIEKVTGLTYSEFGGALMNGASTSRRALVWMLRKRNGEANLRFRDVDFPIEALTIDLDDEERSLVKTELMRNADLTDEERAQALAELGEEDADQEPDPTTPAV